VHRVGRLQHLDVIEDLPQGVCAGSSQKDLRSRRKLRRSRPSNSLKDKCRGVFVECSKEASQVGEQTMSLVERHCFLFVDFHKEERTDEIIRGDFVRVLEPLDLSEMQGGYSAAVERIQSSGEVAPFIQDGEVDGLFTRSPIGTS
jgi:hypothetical protein